MPNSELERFITETQSDSALLAHLQNSTGADAFAAAAARAGAERGYRFSEADVKAYLQEQKQEAELSDAELDQATGGLTLIG